MPTVSFSYMDRLYEPTASAVKLTFMAIASKNVAYDGGSIGNAVLQPLDKEEYVLPFVPFKWSDHISPPIQQVYDYPDAYKVERLFRQSKK